MTSLFDLKCLECKASDIPEGHTGRVFIVFEDRVGEYALCTECWRKRQKAVVQSQLDKRRRVLEEEAREAKRRKKGTSGRGSKPDHQDRNDPFQRG